MKNLLKYTLGALLAIVAMTACTNEYEYDAPSATNQGGNAMVSTGETSFVFVPGQNQTYTITVTRIDTTEAQEIGLTCDNEKFVVPATVSFAANEKSKDITVTSTLVAGESAVANISVAEKDAFLYGVNTVSLSVSVFRSFSGFIQSAFYGNEPWEVSIYEIGDGEYMIPNAFADGYDWYFSINFATNKVTIKGQYVDVYDEEYGRIAFIPSSTSYDPENLLVSATGKFTLPDYGASFNGTHTVYVGFAEDPQK